MSDNNKKLGTSYVVCYPGAIKALFIVCMLFFGAVLFFSMRDGAGLFCYIGFGFFTLFSLFGVLSSVVWKISIDNDEICYCSMFGIKHKYTFADITKVVEIKHMGDNAIYCYSGEKKMFAIDNNIAGYYRFQIDLRIRNIPIDRTKRNKNHPMNEYEDMINSKKSNIE